MKAIVFGNPDCVLGFALAGISGRVLRSSDELALALDGATHDSTIGMILISTDTAALLRERVDQLKETSIVPLVLEIPGSEKDSSFPSVLNMVQRSVGITLGSK